MSCRRKKRKKKQWENVLVPVQHFTVSALLMFLYFKPIIQMLLGSGFNLTLKRTFEKNLIKVVEGLQNSKIQCILLPLSVCSCPPPSLLLLSFIFHSFLISLFCLSFHFLCLLSFNLKSYPSSVCLSV